MLYFFEWSEHIRLLMTVLILLATVVQTLTIILNYDRRLQSNRCEQIPERVRDLLILFILFAFSLMHGHVMMAYTRTLFVPVQYYLYRIGIVISLFVLTLYICFSERSLRPLLAALPSIVLLPVIEDTSGVIYPYIFAAALVFYLFRGTYISLVQYKKIRTGLSSFSVKNAMDTLNSGILFCEKDGHILLVNECMQDLMLTLTGKVHRDGFAFYDMLPAGDADAALVQDQSGIICRAPDERIWMFSKSTLILERKDYTQISATDITQQWHLTGELKRQNDELNQKSDELRETIANLHLLCRRKETQAARIRAHDILGNRLSLLLRTIHSSEAIDDNVLISNVGCLFENMKRSSVPSTAKDDLASLRKTFFSIGVHIHFDGDLPDDTEISTAFAEIIHEAVTNAVRHGFATEVSVHLQSDSNGYCLDISDNGHGAPDGMIEGRGIDGMRSRVIAHNGEFIINLLPCFTISVTVPKGD